MLSADLLHNGAPLLSECSSTRQPVSEPPPVHLSTSSRNSRLSEEPFQRGNCCCEDVICAIVSLLSAAITFAVDFSPPPPPLSPSVLIQSSPVDRETSKTVESLDRHLGREFRDLSWLSSISSSLTDLDLLQFRSAVALFSQTLIIQR